MKTFTTYDQKRSTYWVQLIVSPKVSAGIFLLLNKNKRKKKKNKRKNINKTNITYKNNKTKKIYKIDIKQDTKLVLKKKKQETFPK